MCAGLHTDFLGPMPIPIPIFFSSALADDRYADTDFLEPIFGADAAFAPSIYILKMHKIHNDDNKCYKSQFKKGTFSELLYIMKYFKE